MSSFDALGISVLALSYDEPDALKNFQEAYGITYTLLSDPDSKVIRDYGILNTLIAEDDHPWFGIPFPGTYVADASGTVTHKFFENNLVLRVGPEELLRAVGGDALSEYVGAETGGDGEVAGTDAATGVSEPRVFLEGERLAVGVLRYLVCEIDVPEGRHLYADPAPHGMLPFSLSLDAQPKLVVKDLVRPDSETHTVVGTGEAIQVYHGGVALRLPITVNTAITSATGSTTMTLTGDVRWQMCDDEACDVPRHIRFEIRVPVEGSIVAEFMTKPGNPKVQPMDGLNHFKRMSSRRES